MSVRRVTWFSDSERGYLQYCTETGTKKRVDKGPNPAHTKLGTSQLRGGDAGAREKSTTLTPSRFFLVLAEVEGENKGQAGRACNVCEGHRSGSNAKGTQHLGWLFTLLSRVARGRGDDQGELPRLLPYSPTLLPFQVVYFRLRRSEFDWKTLVGGLVHLQEAGRAMMLQAA
jgi:hypothetical protein